VDKVKIAKEIIRSTLNICRNPLVCFSGGKDSTFMLYLVKQVVDEYGLKMPLVLVADPFPIEENVQFCLDVLKKLNVDKFILMKDFVDEEGLKVYVEKTKDVKTCCLKNKVELLNKIIKQFNIDCVFVAIRWDEHPARATETFIRKVDEPPHLRIHPILHFTWHEVLMFYLEHKDLLNPLYLKGYTSLGCAPCTKPTIDRSFSSVEEYIQFVLTHELVERAGRAQDKERIMEQLRMLGYF